MFHLSLQRYVLNVTIYSM